VGVNDKMGLGIEARDDGTGSVRWRSIRNAVRMGLLGSRQ